MAMESSMAQPVPLPARLSASSTSSPATVGALLTKAAGTGAAPGECRSPRSLLSRILGRGSGGGFGCRLRLPRYCSSGASAAAKEDAGEVVATLNVVASDRADVHEAPHCSLQGKKAAPEVSAATLGLGAGLVLLLSKGTTELSRMAELRTQMERLVMDARAAEARGGGRSVDDSASVVKERIVFADAGAEDTCSSNGSRVL